MQNQAISPFKSNSAKSFDYCSSYSTSDTILTVSSSDGIKFRVHPIIMKMASGVFMNMLDGAQDTGEAVELEEKGDVLKALLDVIHPNGKSIELNGRPFEFVWSLLAAADKYDIRKVTDEIRVRLLSDPYFKSYPLESYAVACRYNWGKEIAVTTAGALDNINAPKSWNIFAQLNAIHIMRLHKLLELRRVYVSLLIKDKSIGTTNYYSDQERKGVLASLVELEIIKFPSGVTLLDQFWTRSGSSRLCINNDRDAENLKKLFNDRIKYLPSDSSLIPL